jgi:hypothetical protein
MNKTKFLATTGKAGIVLNAVLLLTLTGCGDSTNAPTSGTQAQSPSVAQTQPTADAQAQPSVVVETPPPAADVQAPTTVLVGQDNYVYYPSYGIYYNSGRHQYASLQGGSWISEPAPRGVAVADLQASPSVKMNFHDAPANHHAAIVQQYPKNWKPTARN